MINIKKLEINWGLVRDFKMNNTYNQTEDFPESLLGKLLILFGFIICLILFPFGWLYIKYLDMKKPDIIECDGNKSSSIVNRFGEEIPYNKSTPKDKKTRAEKEFREYMKCGSMKCIIN